MFEFYERNSVGETLSSEIYSTYVRVELIARPIEAQNDCAGIVGWWDHGVIRSPGACSRWGLSLVQ